MQVLLVKKAINIDAYFQNKLKVLLEAWLSWSIELSGYPEVGLQIMGKNVNETILHVVENVDENFVVAYVGEIDGDKQYQKYKDMGWTPVNIQGMDLSGVKEPKKIKWTKERPTKPGYYWLYGWPSPEHRNTISVPSIKLARISELPISGPFQYGFYVYAP